MEAYFLSDIHLKSINERNGRTLLRFLNSLAEGSAKTDKSHVHLFLLGDIFDLWLSDHRVFVRKFYPLIEPIKKLIRQGAQIVFFEGNHDLHLHPYWEKQLGVKVYTEAEYFELGPWILRCEHGDLINLEDKAYLRLRATLRHPVVAAAGHYLPGVMWDQLGQFFSRKSRHYSSVDRENKQQDLIKMIRNHAKRSFREKPFDIIITGHMHVRDDYEFSEGSRKVRSINLGSWFDKPVVLKLNDDGCEWLEL